MYILVAEPHGDEAARAFDALDETFGTDEFSQADAMNVLTQHGFGAQMFQGLLTAGSIMEA